jgi:hypothetical protein
VFDPKEFICVSIGFCQPNRSEAEYRTAISRALYTVFLWAREELDARLGNIKSISEEYKGDEHGRVRACFKLGGGCPNYQVYTRLGALYKLRTKSDYNLHETVTLDDVKQALEFAQYISWVFEDLLFKKA